MNKRVPFFYIFGMSIQIIQQLESIEHQLQASGRENVGAL